MDPYEEESLGRLYQAMDSGDVNAVLSYMLEESEPPAVRTSAGHMLEKAAKNAVENGDEELVRAVLERLGGRKGAEGAIEKLRAALHTSEKAVPDGLMKPVPGSKFAKMAPVNRGPKKQIR